MKFKNEKEDIIIGLTEIKCTKWEYYEQLYPSKFNHLDEMHKFLERQKLPKPTQEEIKNRTKSITIKEIKLVIKNLP